MEAFEDQACAPASGMSSKYSDRFPRTARLLRGAERISEWLDERPLILLLLLSATCLITSLVDCWHKPLWHDELFTYNLGRFASLRQMLHVVPKVDLNPPVLYVLEYLSLHLPGGSAGGHVENIVARLPSILGGLCATIGLFAYMRRHVSPLYAAGAVVLLWNTTFFYYMSEDRPYALVIGFLALLVVAWRKATEPARNPIWILALLLLGFAMMGSHFMAVFVLLAFLAAEGVRAWDRKRLDLPVTLSLVAPFSIPYIYSRVIGGFGAMVFPPAFQPHRKTLLVIGDLVSQDFIIFAFVLVLSLIVTTFVVTRNESYPGREAPAGQLFYKSFTPAEWMLLLVLLLEPVMSIVSIARRHAAFFPRYGLPICIPIAILISSFLWWRFKGLKIVGLITVVIGLYAFSPGVTSIFNWPTPPVPNTAYQLIDSDLPLVTDSGLTFVEMNHREHPAFLNRLYYLTDREDAIKYAHATLFEWEAANAFPVFQFQSTVEPLRSFEAAHKKFLVLGSYDYPENWLLRKLQADGATLLYLGSFETGYQSKQLFEVELKEDD